MLETKLRDRLREKLAVEDERAKDMILGGNLQNFSEVRFSFGYRKAIADAQKLLDESFDEIMKE